TCCGNPSYPLANAVERANFATIEIQDIATFDFSRLSLLFLVVDSNNRSTPLFDRLPEIETWVNNGGRLIVHDWFVSTDGGPNPFLFAAPGVVLVQSFNENIQILPPGNNLVVAGPFGNLGNNSLDDAGTSSHGYALRGTLPPRALPILGAGPNTNAVTAFSYGLGAGSVYYAGMPLDHHLNLGGTLGDTFRDVYIPNLVEHAASFTAGGAPLVLDGPHNAGGLEGGTLTLSVGANGQLPLNYQWFFNGAVIPAATNNSIVLSPLSFAQAGAYQVIVGNNLGTITSAVAVVTVVQVAPFRITALTPDSSQIVEHEQVTGDDRGGIAVSDTHVYYTGDGATGRFS
ncbi:MAG TPA: immunoglobulin domain-containing protein, partial [Candidatus Dormibacteraeota bacterium]|nr:immunoglobulin domain-containing protein [Candidatus Dormibacteraeota bacterium]